MPTPDHDTTSKVLVVTWLAAMLVAGVLMLVIGSLVMDRGCMGMCLLPYYLVGSGCLALLPATIAILVSCCACRSQLEQLWGVMAKICLVSMAIRISGTVYILTSVARVSSLDRLCSQSWMAGVGLALLVVDWLLFVACYRLFCVSQLPLPATSTTPRSQPHADSPFHAWKLRVNGSQM